RHFTPAWFAMNMGVGVISILFANFPYGPQTAPMKALSAVFFFLNIFLFLLFLAASLSRYILFPDVWGLMLAHPMQSLYLGCFPMGAVTLINVAVTLFYGEYGFGGNAFLYTLWGLWWLDVAVSCLCCWGLVHVMSTIHEQSLKTMTSIWLLPVVTLIVASSSGGTLALALHPLSETHALVTITASIFLVAIGLTLAFMILTLYLLRLIVHGPPPGASVVSSFVPLGPMGQAGFSVLLIGQALRGFLPVQGSTSLFLGDARVGEIVYVACVCIAFVLWALATMWLAFALLGIQNVVRRTRFPFRIPFWGMIFPNGVYANLTISLYRTFDVRFFRIFGAIYAGITFVLFVAVFTTTVYMVYNGIIFVAPCLEDIDMA
ncbi:C4-dicarboxylate transporter/malic acid transport protein, partial [Auriscalpium vulgare]